MQSSSLAERPVAVRVSNKARKDRETRYLYVPQEVCARRSLSLKTAVMIVMYDAVNIGVRCIAGRAKGRVQKFIPVVCSSESVLSLTVPLRLCAGASYAESSVSYCKLASGTPAIDRLYSAASAALLRSSSSGVMVRSCSA